MYETGRTEHLRATQSRTKGVSARFGQFVGRIPVHSVGGMGLKMHAVHGQPLRVPLSSVESAVLWSTHFFSV